MKINGVEIDFKVSNISHARNFQKAVNDMGKAEKNISQMKDKGSLEAVLSALKDMFVQFFITATGVDVVGTCEDIEEMENMYNDFLEEIKKQKEKVLSPFSLDRIK